MTAWRLRHRPDSAQLQQLLAGLTAVRSGDFGTRLPDGRTR